MDKHVVPQGRANPIQRPDDHIDIGATPHDAKRGSGPHVPEPRRPAVGSDGGVVREQVAAVEATPAGDQYVRHLVSRVAADGVQRHHVLVVTVDGPANGLEAAREGGEADRHDRRLRRRAHVRVLVVEPRR